MSAGEREREIDVRTSKIQTHPAHIPWKPMGGKKGFTQYHYAPVGGLSIRDSQKAVSVKVVRRLHGTSRQRERERESRERSTNFGKEEVAREMLTRNEEHQSGVLARNAPGTGKERKPCGDSLLHPLMLSSLSFAHLKNGRSARGAGEGASLHTSNLSPSISRGSSPCIQTPKQPILLSRLSLSLLSHPSFMPLLPSRPIPPPPGPMYRRSQARLGPMPVSATSRPGADSPCLYRRRSDRIADDQPVSPPKSDEGRVEVEVLHGVQLLNVRHRHHGPHRLHRRPHRRSRRRFRRRAGGGAARRAAGGRVVVRRRVVVGG